MAITVQVEVDHYYIHAQFRRAVNFLKVDLKGAPLGEELRLGLAQADLREHRLSQPVLCRSAGRGVRRCSASEMRCLRV